MRQRWFVFLAALTGCALLATGFAVGVDRLLAATGPAPRLATVSPSVLARAGYTLSAASVPPYCGAVQAASARGWLPEAAGGCPISRENAEAAAMPDGLWTVLETQLARVTAHGQGRDRLEWLVVLRNVGGPVPMYACPTTQGVGVACRPITPPSTATELVFVDAQSGQPLGILVVSLGGFPQPVPYPAPTTGPLLPLPVRVPAAAAAG